MKLMYCAECGDIKSLDRNGVETTCQCGNFTAWWVDPQRGTVKARAYNRMTAIFIGIDNRFLTAPNTINPKTHAEWRELQEFLAEESQGYLFAKDKRNCPVVIIRVGESSDISWDGPRLLPSEMPQNYEI